MSTKTKDAVKWTSIQERFCLKAAESSHKIAVVDRSISISYQRLDQETDKISRGLQARGVKPGDLIAIFMESSHQYIMACLGILKAGAAFMPIPVDLPYYAIADILDDAVPSIIISNHQYSAHLPQDVRWIVIDIQRGDEVWGQVSQELPCLVKTAPEQLAFVAYTSGTTGRPKGVLQIQRALVTSYDARYAFCPYQADERVACNIFFMWEFLRPLVRGATCYIIPDTTIYVPQLLAEFLHKNQITETLFTPSTFQRLIRSSNPQTLREQLNTLNVLWLNGEVVTAQLLAEAHHSLPAHTRVLNTYSICECHDVSNFDTAELTQELGGICPVGYAPEGVQVYVHTPQGLSSSGVGELYVGGEGLGRGYLHLEELTNERFPTMDGVRLYATGDIAEVTKEGLIMIRGRSGSMVKIRGYSVYLGAIEEALRGHCLAQDAVVLVRGEHLSQRLVTYVIRGSKATWEIDSQTQTSSELRRLLSEYLPAYMIPFKFIEVDAFPVDLVTGKLDKNQLMSLEIEQRVDLAVLSHQDISTFKDQTEVMRVLWARALEVDLQSIKTDDDFFERGGHSLSAVDLIMSIEDVFDLKLSGDELYLSPRLKDLMDRLFKTPPARSELKQRFWCDEDLMLHLPTSHLLNTAQHTQGVRLTQARSILITGATGFLGSFLLDALLSLLPPKTHIYCLVRDVRVYDVDKQTDESPAARLQRVHQSYGLKDLKIQYKTKRLSTLTGDLTQPQFGLSLERYTQLSQEVDLIFHCAATVNLQYSYSRLKSSIVDGTRHIIQFASFGKLKTVHHISTNSVLPHKPAANYSEDITLDGLDQQLTDGYSQAKWVAERLMEYVHTLGLPVTIYRPGNIGPHTTSGALNSRDLQTLVWSACLATGQCPIETGWHFEMTPVDRVVRVLISIAEQPTRERVYHIVNPEPLSAEEVFKEMKELGYVQKSITLSQWRQEVMKTGEAREYKEWVVLASALGSFDSVLSDSTSYSIERLNQVMLAQDLIETSSLSLSTDRSALRVALTAMYERVSRST